MQTHVRLLLAFTAFLALTACTSAPHEDADPDATPVAVPAFAAVPPPPDLASEIDTCGAKTYDWIVGKN